MRRQTGRVESRWTAINGLPIHYRASIDPVPPERLPVVLVHGQLVVRGTRDPIVPLAWACQAADLLPRGQLIEIPGAAHTINYFAPRQFARVLRVFFGLSPLTTKAPELSLDHA